MGINIKKIMTLFGVTGLVAVCGIMGQHILGNRVEGKYTLGGDGKLNIVEYDSGGATEYVVGDGEQYAPVICISLMNTVTMSKAVSTEDVIKDVRDYIPRAQSSTIAIVNYDLGKKINAVGNYPTYFVYNSAGSSSMTIAGSEKHLNRVFDATEVNSRIDGNSSVFKDGVYYEWVSGKTDEELKKGWKAQATKSSNITKSKQVWDYITKLEGSQFEINKKIDKYLNAGGVNLDKVSSLSSSKLVELRCRYIDLLMTLYSISVDSIASAQYENAIDEYIDGINGSKTNKCNLAITTGVVCHSRKGSTGKTYIVSSIDYLDTVFGIQVGSTITSKETGEKMAEKAGKHTFYGRFLASIQSSVKAKPNVTRSFNSSGSVWGSNVCARLIKDKVVLSKSSPYATYGGAWNALNIMQALYLGDAGNYRYGLSVVPAFAVQDNVLKDFSVRMQIKSSVYNKKAKFSTKVGAKKSNPVKCTVKVGESGVTTIKDVPMFNVEFNAKKDLDSLNYIMNNYKYSAIYISMTRRNETSGGAGKVKKLSVQSKIYETNKTNGQETGYLFKNTFNELLKLMAKGKWTSSEDLSKLDGDGVIASTKIKENEKIMFSYTLYISILGSNESKYNLTSKDYKSTNTVYIEYTGKKSIPDEGDGDDNPGDGEDNTEPDEDAEPIIQKNYVSEPIAFSEIKQGAVYNETYEAMAGVPTTERLYYSAGGSEFIVEVQVENTGEQEAQRRYKSYFAGGVDCEFKEADTAKGHSLGGVGVDAHSGGHYTASQTWSGSIPNKATAVTVTGLHNATATCTAQPDRTAFEQAKQQAQAYADQINNTQLSYTSGSDKKTRNKTGWSASVKFTYTDPQTTSDSKSKQCSFKAAVTGTDDRGNTITITPEVPCGNEMVTATAQPGAAGSYRVWVEFDVPSHSICGPCCQHVLTQDVSDTWTEKLKFETLKITEVHVWKIEKAIVDGMEQITYDETDELKVGINSGDPNIFYNIADSNTSLAGRLRYSLQPQQHDNVIWYEYSNLGEKRTNKCNGLGKTTGNNVSAAGGGGHNESWATGILYNNTGYSDELDYHKDKGGVNTGTSARADSKDVKTYEWNRFNTRRNTDNKVTVISDFLILQTSSGDQSIVYFDKSQTKKAQEEYESMVYESSTDAMHEMWDTNANVARSGNGFTGSIDDINIGSYNGDYSNITGKYEGTGKNKVVSTVFDNDPAATTQTDSNARVPSALSYKTVSSVVGGESKSSPGLLEQRMSRVTGLRMVLSDIRQNPINENGLYTTGESSVYYKPILDYDNGEENDMKEDIRAYENESTEFGDGYLVSASYSRNDTKVNDIVVFNPVSVENATIVGLDSSRDQRTTIPEGSADSILSELTKLDKCSGDPATCEFRHLDCKFFQDVVSSYIDFDSLNEDKNEIKDGITNKKYDISNTDGVSIDNTNIFGYESSLYVNGGKLRIPFEDMGIQYSRSNRIQVEMQLYVNDYSAEDRTIVGLDGVSVIVEKNKSYITVVDKDGNKKEFSAANVVRNKLKLTVVFSSANMNNVEIYVNDSKISGSSINVDDLKSGDIGDYINIGEVDETSGNGTGFYVDNFKVTRLAGTHGHNYECYTTVKEHATTVWVDCEKEHVYEYTGKEEEFVAPYTGYYTVNMYGAEIKNATNGEAYGSMVKGKVYLTKGQKVNINVGGTGEAKVGKQSTSKTNSNLVVVSSKEYKYTGAVQEVTLEAGTYKLETFGAQGASVYRDNNKNGVLNEGGKGGYTGGNIVLTKATKLYLYVGGQGQGPDDAIPGKGGWNGGGSSNNGYAEGRYGTGKDGYELTGGGGGGTDIRMGGTELKDRIIVAGGGGGADMNDNWASNDKSGGIAGAGGGLAGLSAVCGNYPNAGNPGTQNSGFSKGKGSDGYVYTDGRVYSAGSGGGYIGGTTKLAEGPGSGGSGYIGFKLTDGVSIDGANRFVGSSYPNEVGHEGNGLIIISELSEEENNTGYNKGATTLTFGGKEIKVRDSARISGTDNLSSLVTYKGVKTGNGYVRIYEDAHVHTSECSEEVTTNNVHVHNETCISVHNEELKAILAQGSQGNYPLLRQYLGDTVANIMYGYLLGYKGTEAEMTKYVYMLQENIALIPDKVDSIKNVVFDCDGKYNEHVCTAECKEEKELVCTDPHHKEVVEHYGYDNKLCWSACNNDENHKSHKTEIEDENGNKIDSGTFVNLDYGFKVYFPNVGNFSENESLLGVGTPSLVRGKGYTNGMDTSEWTREKRIKFEFDVLFNRGGVWEQYLAGEWIELPVKGATYPYYEFYCSLSNNEVSSAKVEYSVEAINCSPSSGGKDDIYLSDKEDNNKNTKNTNRLRYTDYSAEEGAYGSSYVDVVGRIGNLLITDTDDLRFSNLFKVAVGEDKWIVEGILKEVYTGVQNSYLSWFTNEEALRYKNGMLGTEEARGVDIRGEKVSKATGMYNTYGTQRWTENAKDVPLPLSSDRNNVVDYKNQLWKPGYNALLEISTIGDYTKNLQVIPYFYSLNLETNAIEPVDVYMISNDEFKMINMYDAVNRDDWNEIKGSIYSHVMSLDWENEAVRRNYDSLEKEHTEYLAGKMITRVYDTNGNETGIQRMIIPSGEYYAMGNVQLILAGKEARTFIGSSKVSNLSINGSNETNIENKVDEELYWYHGQRWHLKLGLPSSAVFVPYRDDEHVEPDTLIDNPNGTGKISAYEELKDGKHVILMTAYINAIGEQFILGYNQGADNGVVEIGGKTYTFGNDIPTLIGIYDINTSIVDVDIEGTH